jgi:hypothetical protein
MSTENPTAFDFNNFDFSKFKIFFLKATQTSFSPITTTKEYAKLIIELLFGAHDVSQSLVLNPAMQFLLQNHVDLKILMLLGVILSWC